MIDHTWAQENLDAYLAGGLTDDERTALDEHLANCAECAQSLKAARKLETTMKTLFADAPPAAGLEQRAIARLRRQPTVRPRWVRYVIGAAAVLVLGLIGAVAQAILADGGPHMAEAFRYQRVAQRGFTKVTDTAGRVKENSSMEGFSTSDADPAAKKNDAGKDNLFGLFDEAKVGGWVDANEAVGAMRFDGGVNQPPFPESKVGGSNGKSLMSGLSQAGTLTPDVGESAGIPPASTFYGRSGASDLYSLRLDNRSAEKEERENLGGKVHTRIRGASIAANSPSYFKPGGGDKPTTGAPPPPATPLQIAEANLQRLDIFEKKEQAKEAAQPKDGPPPPLVPESVGRKIIRTGEMEFEVESFDAAVTGIGNLIGAVKGGFIATVNSDKLANGKMKGAVVVRMPPQYLDKFLFDVRGALGKNSELKHQRIGSQDVSKQFTDTESRLRAARTMEERFLKIIQTGKGEVKDLIAAERELGVWRTKIEEMQGEINYYNNQVGLSTLTINLTEKEISTPFALVTSEKVQMRLEVEEVGKALEAALRAVDQFKGRVVKSESKQHKAGQVEAFLHAEVPAPLKESFRKELRKLGIVSEDESTQKTQSEGGSGKPGKLEPKVNDVTFEVTLNNIVNIPPRNSVNLDIASNDVGAAFARLEAFVLKKGQMRVANKSEPDKQRVTAFLEFNVPNEIKDEADKLIAAVGPVLKATNVQMPITEVATDQKFGYKVSLFSVAVIAPREVVKLRLEVDDVAVRAAEIEALGKASKGQVERGRFLQSPQGTTTTVVMLRLPMPVADTLVGQFMKMGKQVIEREQTPNPNAPENELATTAVIVTLTGGSPIVPTDEGLGKQISKGLYWAFWMFCMCMIFIVSGLAFVAPIVVVIWACIKIGVWLWGGTQTSAVTPKPAGGEEKPAS